MLNPYQTIPAKISAIKEETPSIKIFKVVLKKPLIFKLGQFVLVSYPGFGEAAFAPCSSPDKPNELELCIRQVGTLTEKLHQLKAGDKISIRGPYGNGWPISVQSSKPAPCEGKGFKVQSDNFSCHPEPRGVANGRSIPGQTPQNLLLVAGGMGLVPLRSVILQYLGNKKAGITAEVSPKQTKFISERIPEGIQVFYGVKTPADLIFKSDFDSWQKAGINLEVIVEQKLPNWFGHIGTITTLFDNVRLIKNAKCFMVGPPIMYQFVLPKLTAAGFKDEDIFVSLERRMQCGLGICQHCAIGSYYVCRDGPVFCWSDLKKLGEVYKMM